MWNSGQSAPPAPNWGWPPNMNYQYNQQNEVDPSEGWAAAAALWAQQRKLQEQYQNAPSDSQQDKPPEPPGPPPDQPLLPPDHMQHAPPLPPADPHYPPVPPNSGSNEQNIEVHEYNHGQRNQEQHTDVIDYQHGLQSNQMPYSGDTNVFDYNHGKDQTSAENWNYNEMWQQQIAGYYADNNRDQWNQWNEQGESYNQPNEYFEDQERQHDNSSVKSDYSRSSSGRHDKRQHAPNVPVFSGTQFSGQGSGSNSPDLAEIAKKTKGLPLWLRQGLQKMENEKKKQSEKEKAKEDIPNAKLVSGYQHHSPASSPDVSEKEQSEDEEDVKESRKQLPKNYSRKSRFEADHSPEVRRKAASDESDPEEKEIDDEEKQRRLIMKIKTWMTEILLGVTNDELRSLCEEVYFEVKRKAKVKATQIRRSGGLDALRSGDFGDEDETSSESESEAPPPKPKAPPKREPTPEPSPEPSPEPEPKPLVKREMVAPEETPLTQRLSEAKKAKESTTTKLVKRNEVSQSVGKRDSGSSTSSKSKTVVTSKENGKVSKTARQSNENLSNRDRKSEKKKKHSPEQSSSSASTDDSSESESDSSSSESEAESRRKKSKRKRSVSRSPIRKSRKKSSKKHRRRSSSSESDQSRKKRKRKYSDSSDESSYRKKKIKGKKQKHKSSRSVSRSPPRRHSKKKR